MSQASPDRVREILYQATQLPEAQRNQFLEAATEGDETLLGEVRELLALYPSGEQFMKRPLAEALAENVPNTTLARGTILRDRYRVLDQIAVGGFATVYLAADELLEGRQVVVKVMDRVADMETFHAVFKREVSALSRVHHPSIIGISDVGSTDLGKPFVVLAFVSGQTLREVLNRGSVTPARAFALLSGIGKALAAAHAAGVWHLDLKPENVIVTASGEPDEHVTLIDFGIARLKEISGPGLTARTPAYSAPEQLESPGGHTDIFLLSLLAFELFTGHLPNFALPVENQLPKSLPRKTVRTIANGLNPIPSRRPATVNEFVDGIRSVAATRQHRWLVLLSVAAIIAFGALGLTFYKRAITASSSHYDLPVPFVVSDEREHRPVLSPDGKYVYYVAGYQHQQDIYRKPVGGGEPTLVVGGPADESWPAISPDQTRMIFKRTSTAGEEQLISKVLPDGPERILLSGAASEDVSFTPDGERFVLVRLWPDGYRRIYAFRLKSGEGETIELPVENGCGIKRARLAPDGKSLAFSCGSSLGFEDLYIVSLDPDLHPRAKPQRLTKGNERIESFDWTPDSRGILFVGGPIGFGVIKRVFLDRPQETEITHIPAERVEALSVARFVNRLVYSKHLSDSNIYAMPLNPQGEPATLIRTSYEDELPQYSPDGSRVIASSMRAGMPEVWAYNADGSGGRRLFSFLRSETGSCTWLPFDASQLLCGIGSKQLGPHIVRGDANSGETTMVLEGYGLASISPSGKWLYITSQSKPRRSIHRVAYPSLTGRHLVAEGGVFGLESLDGEWFYYATGEPALGVFSMRLPDGPPTNVIKGLRRRDNFVLARNGIYYIAPRDRTSTQMDLYFLPFNSTTPKRLHAFSKDIGWGVSLSPDERTLLFTQIESSNIDILLVNSFR